MKTFFQNNRSRLGEALEIGDLALIFSGKAPKSTADAHYEFKTNKNMYYLSGCQEENFILAIHKLESGIKSTIFIEKPDYDIEKWVGYKTTKEAVIEKSGVEEVQYLDQFNAWINKLVYDHQVQQLYLDMEKLSWDELDSEAMRFGKSFHERYPFISLRTIHPTLVQLRSLKSDFEVNQIQKAVDLTKEGLDEILKVLKPGVKEYQLEATFKYHIRMNGADSHSFPIIAASGQDAVILHYVENNKTLKAGDLVLLDLGAQYEEYAADISRTYPVSGRFTERQKLFYNVVLKAQEKVIEAMKPGEPIESLNKICQNSIAEDLIEIGLIKEASEVSQYYYHGVSHHLGLDVHDLGPRQGKLQEGMILTVEPGLYIKEENIGIRLEEDVLITSDGHRVLSANIPKTVEEIEAIMAENHSL